MAKRVHMGAREYFKGRWKRSIQRTGRERRLTAHPGHFSDVGKVRLLVDPVERHATLAFIMSTILWPPLSDTTAVDLTQRAEETRQGELSWLLDALQETLSSLKSGLEDCSALLAPREQGSTLVVSSHRSEAVKGTITRNGSNITKGDVQLRLASLPPPRGQTSYKLSISAQPSAPALQLKQIAEVRTLINSSLDVVDATTWTGDKGDANFISGQLTLLHENIRDAKAVLKGPPAASDSDKSWASDPLDDKVRRYLDSTHHPKLTQSPDLRPPTPTKPLLPPQHLRRSPPLPHSHPRTRLPHRHLHTPRQWPIILRLRPARQARPCTRSWPTSSCP